MKKYLFIVACLFLLACSNKSSIKKDMHEVKIESNDKMIDYYNFVNVQKFVSRQAFDESDLKYQGHLLLTPGGIIKGMKYGPNWHEVADYHSTYAGGGWYFIKVDIYLNNYSDDKTTLSCFTKEHI